MIKKIIKIIRWFFSSEGGSGSTKEWREVARIIDNDSTEKIFAEIDNDLIRQIDNATKEFKKAQLKHIPCQILYYSKFEIKSTIAMTRLFLKNRNRIIKGVSIRLEDGSEIHSGDYHENTKYIKYKGKYIQ